jgi:EmrB/QacA subfamily drug resistance transporter
MSLTTNQVISPPGKGSTFPGLQVDAHAVLEAHPWRWQALGVLCIGLLLIALDTTVLNVALPTLARQLRASTSALQWIVDGYTVALGCLLLLFGAVGDRFGRRRMLLAGLAVFAVASVFAAYAHSTNALIGARVLAGVGGAVILPCTLASVLSLFPDPRERATALGVWSATLGLGVVIGPVTGGVLLAHFWFGSIFLLNVPIAVTAFALTFWILPESRSLRRRGRLDLPGAGLAILGAGAILWGLIEAPDSGWLSLSVLTALLLGLLATAAFVLWERVSSAPLFPARLFASPGFRLGTASITLLFFAVYGFLFALTQDLQLRLGFGALAAGVRMLPAGVLLISAAAAPALARRIGPRAVLGFGLLAIGAGLAVVALTSSVASYSPIAAGLVLVGGGMGLTMPTAEDVVLSSVEPDDAGVGAGANSTNLQLGGSLGVALIGSIAITTYRHHLAHLANVPPAAVQAARSSLYAATATAVHMPGGVRGPFFTAAVHGFSQGLQVALLVCAGVSIVGAVAVASMRRPRPPSAPRHFTSDSENMP